jgi:hypothetical protein
MPFGLERGEYCKHDLVVIATITRINPGIDPYRLAPQLQRVVNVSALKERGTVMNEFPGG